MPRLTVTLSIDEREFVAMRTWAARRIMTEGKKRKTDDHWGFATMERAGAARRLVATIDAAGRDAAVDYCG
jgi:hypothetical protein